MNSNFFKDKNGIDRFSIFLATVSVIFLLSKSYVKLLGICILGYAAWRTLSKDKYKRHNEEMAFEDTLIRMNYRLNRLFKGNPIKKLKYKFTEIAKGLKDQKDFKIVKCPNCGQKLRLPRGKGKITVTCRKCSHQFKMKS